MKQCDVRTSGRDGQLVAALHPGVVDSVSGVKQVKAENCVGPVLILTVQWCVECWWCWCHLPRVEAGGGQRRVWSSGAALARQLTAQLTYILFTNVIFEYSPS